MKNQTYRRLLFFAFLTFLGSSFYPLIWAQNKESFLALNTSRQSRTALSKNTQVVDSDLAGENVSEAYRLVWHDEFDQGAKPDTSLWNYEQGFVRNKELQWYQSDNAFVRDGYLHLIARREQLTNPNFKPDAKSWREQRRVAHYTSASIHTKGKFSFKYGVLEVRAKIDTAMGLWPAIWTLGLERPWPEKGEVDLMEFYRINGEAHILANAAWGSAKAYTPIWDSEKIPLRHFLDQKADWAEHFHIWKMVWTEDRIALYLDDELLNEIDLTKVYNADGSQVFHQEQYILLNLAIGQQGGDPSSTSFPKTYLVDYVRVYQKRD